jgi:transcriptional regulator with XRE-family HTH domain
VVRTERLRAKLTQESLAESAGLERAYIGRLERGLNNPTVLTLERVARALHLAGWELLRRAVTDT